MITCSERTQSSEASRASKSRRRTVPNSSTTPSRMLRRSALMTRREPSCRGTPASKPRSCRWPTTHVSMSVPMRTTKSWTTSPFADSSSEFVDPNVFLLLTNACSHRSEFTGRMHCVCVCLGFSNVLDGRVLLDLRRGAVRCGVRNQPTLLGSRHTSLTPDRRCEISFRTNYY